MEQKTWYTRDEAAKYLGLAKQTLNQWVTRGRMLKSERAPLGKNGRMMVVYHIDELNSYLDDPVGYFSNQRIPFRMLKVDAEIAAKLNRTARKKDKTVNQILAEVFGA